MYVFLQYFDTVGWVFWPLKTVARITYTVLEETLNPAQSIKTPYRVNQSAITPSSLFQWVILQANLQYLLTNILQ